MSRIKELEPGSANLSGVDVAAQGRPRIVNSRVEGATQHASINPMGNTSDHCALRCSAQAQQTGETPLTVKIGVLSDMSGLYADVGGPGSVAAANMAVEDFNPASHDMKVEIVSADHQNKPDIGSAIARRWFDVDQVNAIADVPNSGVALAEAM